MNSGKVAPHYLANYLDFGYSHPQGGDEEVLSMIPGAKLTETKQGNFKSTNCIHPPTQRAGGRTTAESWSLEDADEHGTEMAFWLGDDRWLHVPRGCPKLEAPPQPCILGAAPGLAAGTGLGDRGPRLEDGTWS